MNIQETIRNLLALAKNNSNINEAANAFSQAQRLITKHKIAEADIDCEQPRIEKQFIIKTICEVTNIVSWKSFLCNQLSILNGCKFWTSHQGQAKFCIAGLEQDIMLVEYMFQSISNQIEYLCELARTNKFGYGKSYYNSFKIGAVTTVIERLKNSQQDELAKASSSALACIQKNDREIINFVCNKVPGLKQKTSKYVYVSDGINAGKQAGNKVLLNKGLNS